jgi:hypothetical protein
LCGSSKGFTSPLTAGGTWWLRHTTEPTDSSQVPPVDGCSCSESNEADTTRSRIEEDVRTGGTPPYVRVTFVAGAEIRIEGQLQPRDNQVMIRMGINTMQGRGSVPRG